MGVADADGQGIGLAEGEELPYLLGIGNVLVFQHNAFVVQPLQFADFRFYRHIEYPGDLYNGLGQSSVVPNGHFGAVDHYGGEAQLQRLHADAEAVAVIQVDGDRDGNLVGTPLGNLYKPVVAGVCAGGDVMGQNDGGFQLLRRFADSHDNVVVSTLGVDGGNCVAIFGSLAQLFQIVR